MLVISCQCYAQKDICTQITRQEDRTGGIVTYTSPLIGSHSMLSITKVLEDNEVSYIMYAGVPSGNEASELRGMLIRLEDGTEIKDTECIVTSTLVDEGMYNLSAKISLTDSQLEMLSLSRVESLHVGNVTGQVAPKDAAKWMDFARCMMDR